MNGGQSPVTTEEISLQSQDIIVKGSQTAQKHAGNIHLNNMIPGLQPGYKEIPNNNRRAKNEYINNILTQLKTKGIRFIVQTLYNGWRLATYQEAYNAVQRRLLRRVKKKGGEADPIVVGANAAQVRDDVDVSVKVKNGGKRMASNGDGDGDGNRLNGSVSKFTIVNSYFNTTDLFKI